MLGQDHNCSCGATRLDRFCGPLLRILTYADVVDAESLRLPILCLRISVCPQKSIRFLTYCRSSILCSSLSAARDTYSLFLTGLITV